MNGFQTFCCPFVSAAEPRTRDAGALPRPGPSHAAGPETSVWTGLSRPPFHAHAVRLWREPHAGSGPAGGLWAYALADGARWQLSWYGWNGGHGEPTCQHDETKNDEPQQAHEAAAAAEASGTAGMSPMTFSPT